MGTASGNVVPLGDHPRAKARLSPQESQSVLTGCRELALDRIGKAMSGMLDRVEDELFELAEKSPERDAQNVFLDARAQARANRAAIESTFRRHFVEFFNRKVRGDAAAAPRVDHSTELALVADEDLEESLAVSEMSRKLKSACEGELAALSQRMGFLLERPELEDDANPISPATVCAALKHACDQINSNFKVRMALLHQLEHHTEVILMGLYHDLNTHLVERRILPDVRPTARRSPPSGAPRQDKPDGVPPSQSPQASQGAQSSQPAQPSDLFGSLAQLLSASSNAAGNAAPAAGPSPVAGGIPGAGGMPGAPEFVAGLTRMHREAPYATSATGDGLVNVVKVLRASPESASLGTVDAMTIDIVAMLFDYVFEDRQIPACVKALLGRLQIPVLKVALLDKSFFSSKSHPARRLIDLLAEISIGLDEDDERGGATLALIEGVVESVLSEFDTDLGLFASLVERVEAFVKEQTSAEDDLVQRSAQLIEAREREEIARLVAEEEVGRRMQARAWVPAPVRQMLMQHWTRAFASVQGTEGEGSPAWQALVQTMDDLLWSVEPKALPDDRKRLVGLLPGMLRQIHDGLKRAGMSDEERDVFLGSLVDCHATAVKAGLRGMAAVPEAPVPVPFAVSQDPTIERQMLPAGAMQVEEIRLKAGPVRNVFTRTGVWTNLQRGTWVEFIRTAGNATRARLTWISPNKGVYLFTNPLSGAVAMSISPEALAEQMRLGQARVIDDAPLVERAVDSMMENLRKAQGGN
jgi:Protein of unknown function (DUF1631)